MYITAIVVVVAIAVAIVVVAVTQQRSQGKRRSQSIYWSNSCIMIYPSIYLPITIPLRCVKVVIAGASLERGRKVSSFTKLACNSLRCIKCNFRVHCFLNSSWDSTIDYMFLRNTVPNEAKLAKKLVVAGDSCAYCCQCTSVSETGERELNSSNPAGPQWVCSGHWLEIVDVKM